MIRFLEMWIKCEINFFPIFNEKNISPTDRPMLFIIPTSGYSKQTIKDSPTRQSNFHMGICFALFSHQGAIAHIFLI